MKQSSSDRLQTIFAVLIVVGSGALLGATLAYSRVDTIAAETTLTRSIVAVVAEHPAPAATPRLPEGAGLLRRVLRVLQPG